MKPLEVDDNSKANNCFSRISSRKDSRRSHALVEIRKRKGREAEEEEEKT